MMKHLLTIVLCLTTLTGLAQEEKIKKSDFNLLIKYLYTEYFSL